MNKISIVILAAGKGTRMCSSIPKVLHLLAGKPIIKYLIDISLSMNVSNIYLVYGYGAKLMKTTLMHKSIYWILQEEQLGTGHAMQKTIPYLHDKEDILILYGDLPLIKKETLDRLILAKPKNGIGLLTAIVKNPTDYGRIIRHNGKIINIIEEKDLTNEQFKINEINTGILIANGSDLKRWLIKLNNYNAQNEYYLTDIISIAHQEGCKINSIYPTKLSEINGINNFLQLSIIERIYQQEQAEKLLLSGVRITDPTRFDLRGKLTYGSNITIDPNVIIEGNVVLGKNIHIHIGCILKNCIIDDNTIIKAYSLLNGVVISKNCTIGPFVNLRPGTKLADNVNIGNFVEIKNSNLNKKSKVGHLSYLGDAIIGNHVNIGAGTITCNYDGINKYNTIIGDNVFIGSDTQLIAPVKVGNGVTIGAGTTVTKNIQDNELVISRIKQKHISNWQRSIKKI